MIGDWYSTLALTWWNWIWGCFPGILLFYGMGEAMYRWGKRIPSALRYFILLLILAKCVIPAFWTVQVPMFQKSEEDISRYWVPDIESLSNTATGNPVGTTPATFSVIPDNQTSWNYPPAHQILFGINLLGSIVLLVWMGSRWRRFHRHLYTLSQNKTLCDLAASLCVPMNLHIPRIFVSHRVCGSLTGGWIRPYIVVSAPLLEKSIEHRRAVLAHELAHIQRGDAWVNGFQVFLTVFCWWNPLIHRLNYLIRCEREHCCDDRVLQSLEIEPERYSTILLDSAKEQFRFQGLGWGVAFAYPRHALYQRIRRMIMQDNKKKKFGWVGTGIALVLAGSLFFEFQMADASEKNQNLVDLMKKLQHLQLAVMNAYAQGVEVKQEDLQNFNQAVHQLDALLVGNATQEVTTDTKKQEEWNEAVSDQLMDAYRRGDKAQLEKLDKELHDLYKARFAWMSQMEYRPGEYTDSTLAKFRHRVEADIRALQNALECFFIDNNQYPIPIEGNRLDQAGMKIETTDGYTILRLTNPVAYLQEFPKDPFDPQGKTYRYFSNGSFYCVVSNGPDLTPDYDETQFQGKGNTDVRNSVFIPENGSRSQGDIIVVGP